MALEIVSITEVRLVMFGEERTLLGEPVSPIREPDLRARLYRLPSWIRVQRFKQTGDIFYVFADIKWWDALTSWSFWRGVPGFLFRRLAKR